MGKLLFFTLCLAFFATGVLAATYDVSPYKSSNALIWDKGFKQHLIEYFGDKREAYFWKGATIAEQIRAGFGGPPEDIINIAEDTYLASACRQHSCDEKSAYITNGESDLFGMIAYFCSSTNGTVEFCSDGRLIIFYRDEMAKKTLSQFLIQWKNEMAPKAEVTYESVM